MALETVLETDRLRFTNWLPEHANEIFDLHSDPEVARYLIVTGEPETKQQALDRINLWAENFKTHRMGKLRVTLKDSDMLVGRAGFGLYRPTGEPEIGYALFRKHWGNGYAQEAAAGLRDWIFRETEHPHFIGFADTRNAASLKILLGIGMQPTHVGEDDEGHLCKFHIFKREDWRG